MGIRCNAIAPGFFDTASTRNALSEANLQHVERSVPTGRLGELAELYLAVRFLLENEYMNGAILELNGGLVI